MLNLIATTPMTLYTVVRDIAVPKRFPEINRTRLHMSSDRILTILALLAAIIAVVPAAAMAPWALILVALGLISGFMNPEEDLLMRVGYFIVAAALPTVANSLDAIPVAGTYLNSILDNFAVAIAGIVIAQFIMAVKDRVMPADDSSSSAGAGGGGFSSE